MEGLALIFIIRAQLVAAVFIYLLVYLYSLLIQLNKKRREKKKEIILYCLSFKKLNSFILR